MTTENKKRTIQAIEETQHLLNKELGYRRDLQDDSRVSFYMNHIAKLENELEG